MKFYRNEQIEQIAEQRLHEFAQKLERPLSFPIDIELFGDLVLGLSMLWEEIEEIPGEEVLAGLRAPDRLIVMNERHQQEEEEGKLELLLSFSMPLSEFCLLVYWLHASLAKRPSNEFHFMFHLFSPLSSTYFASHKTDIRDEGSKNRAGFCWIISLFL